MRLAGAGALASTQALAQAPRAASIQVRLTAGTKRYSAEPSLEWRPGQGRAEGSIALDPKRTYQDILGFGASFTDASCYMLNQLEPAAREKLMRELFDPAEMGFSVCRLCIGSSDYATHLYSYDDGEPDPDLRRFSIANDREYILPMIRLGRQINPALFLFGSPWSPPGWMKANNSMLGGAMQRKHLAEYAVYLTKFLEAYAAEGVPVDGITSQNEVDAEQDGRMPACVWPQELEIEFVGRHLGPMLAAKGIGTKIWLIDHNYDLWGRAICELDDPAVSKYAEGVAWHGYSGKPEMMSRVHDAHPVKNMYWTEGGPDVTDPKYLTNWAQWSTTFAGILRNWCRSITGWNLALDEQGKPNIGPFPCGGVVTVNSKTKEVSRSGQYWAFAHHSRAIRRGARRFDSRGEIEGLAHVGFLNPDGGGVLVLTNMRADRTVQLQMAGLVTEVAVPADSAMTLTWS